MPPVRRGQSLSIYIQLLRCRRKGSTFDLTLPILGVGDRSAMNQTTDKPPLQPVPCLLSHLGAESCLLLPAPAFPAPEIIVPGHIEILQLEAPTPEPPEL